ncbi:MAG: Gx transporter family protein [Candidatus Cloacimonetes bacterium]|nr:Gx transporter family protein [Candidatus Cloacimonadota bacterium]
MITKTDNKIIKLAFFTAFAVTVYVLESFIPKPLPFMRLGLANIVVLLLLISSDFKSASIVAISKTIIGGFFSGALLSPTTLLSLSGSILSLCLMFLTIRSHFGFSIIGISIIGAVAHNLTQIVVVRILLIRENSIFYLTPILVIMGIVTGIVTGYLTYLIKDSLFAKEDEELFRIKN